MGRLAFLRRISRNRILIPHIGASLIYALQPVRRPLLNEASDDTDTQAQWPKKKAVGQTRRSGVIQEAGNDTTSQNSDRLIEAESEALPEDKKSAAWASFSSALAAASAAIPSIPGAIPSVPSTIPSIPSIPWAAMGESITDYILPEWIKELSAQVAKLQSQLGSSPGSLAEEIWQEAHDISINPEIEYMARVRIGKDLCMEEKEFKRRRKIHTTRALAKYLDIPENEIHPEDVPTIAICSSGGGLRAMIAGCGSYMSAKEAGLFDCATYMAGVSGSCWLQTLYYSSISKQTHQKIINHLIHRLDIHIASPPEALKLLTSAPTNKFLLSGFVEKLKGDSNADFGVVDIYGLLLATRLLVPRGELEVDDRNLKISNQRAYIANGENPLPIYTAVRHEIPVEEQELTSDAAQEKAKQEDWFQWFEFTPYELFCEELEAGIPSWGIGRRYHNGSSVSDETGLHLPEYRIPTLMGIWGSAFCATLAHYYDEIRPVIKGITGLGGLDGMITERNEDLTKLHPIDPASIPNYVLGLDGRLPATSPKSIFSAEHLQLADAGMSNNLPLYPLLRAGREVDILIAFDSSKDVKTENWLSVADGYAKQRGIKGWPIGAGWPKEGTPKAEIVKDLDTADAKTQEAAQSTITAAAAAPTSTTDSENISAPPEVPLLDEKLKQISETTDQKDLTYCNVWVGSTMERSAEEEPPPSKRLFPGSSDWELSHTTDGGLTLIYFPLLPNEDKAPGVDPRISPYLSTWNFIYTPEEVRKVVALAQANFEEGKVQTKMVVRAVYERKKKKRLEREESELVRRWWKHLRDGGDHFQR